MTRSTILGALLLAALAAPGAAQTSPAPGALTVQAGLRVRAEAWDWFDPEAAGEYAFLGSTLRAGLAQQWSRAGWQVELAAPLLLGLPDDAVAPAPRGQLGLGAAYWAANDQEENAAGLFLKQAHLRLGAAAGAAGHGARLGRFEFVEGAEVAPRDPTLAALKRDRIAHRLLGTFAWSHAGRSFDGLHYAYTAPRWNATAVAVRPTRGVFTTEGWGGLEVGVGYASLTLRDREGSPGEARLFALHYHDARDWDRVVKSDNRALAARQADREDVRVTTLGGHYLRLMPTPLGTVDAVLWGAYQLGDWGGLEHRAWAADVEAGLQPPLLGSLRPWIRVGHYRGTGDDRADDRRHGTFFQNLPTPRIHARFPFYNLMNVRDSFASLVLRPGPRLTLRTDVRALELDSAADLWYSGGGAFEEGSFGFAGRPAGGSDALATLLDASAELRLTPRLTGTLYYGRARAGEAIERVYPGGASGSLGYLELEYRR